jgi:HEAT repeat protein
MVKIPLLRLKIANHDDRALGAEVDLALAQVAPRTEVLRFYHITEAGGALQALAGAVSGMQGHDEELGRLIDEVEGGEDPRPTAKKPEPLELVLKKLADPDAAKRLEAVADLGIIGHRDCLPQLVRALRDADAEVALAAAEAAAGIGLAEPADGVLAVLRDRALPASSRGAAAHLLGLAKLRSAAPAVAAELGAEKNAQAAELMVRALGRLGVREAAEPALVAALGEGAPRVRAAAAEALGALGARSAPAVEALVRAADDPEKPAAAAAREALGSVTGKSFPSAADWRRWWQESRANWK